MPELQKDARPRRMHGITPTPFEMPPDLIPTSKAKNRQPLFVRLICGYLLILGGANLFLALVPWDDPESRVATFLSARPDLTFSLLPRAVQPALASGAGSAGAYAQGLPFIFLIFGGIYLFCTWKLWNLDKFWVSIIRWGMMFISGANVLKTMILLSARYVGEAEAPLSDQTRFALVIYITWNLLIFFCFAGFPRVEEAYDSES
ncbi:MAG: hypothetical protein ABSB30_07990 [Terracidiphilus sp.]